MKLSEKKDIVPTGKKFRVILEGVTFWLSFVFSAQALNSSVEYGITKLAEDTPKAAQQIEGYFPGATFIFLGRDMLLLYEAFKWLYNDEKKNERVKTLGFSHETLEGLDCKDVLAYLQGKGLDFPPQSHPWVFIDTISYGKGRQGKAILKCLYQEGAEAHDPFLAFVGLRISTTPFGMLSLRDHHHRMQNHFWSRQEGTLPRPEPLMASISLEAAEAGYTDRVGCLHGPFGPLKRTRNGVFDSPGKACDQKEQEAFLEAKASLLQKLKKTQKQITIKRSPFCPKPLEYVQEMLPRGLPFQEFASTTEALKHRFKFQLHWSYWAIFARFYTTLKPNPLWPASAWPGLSRILKWGPHHSEASASSLQKLFRPLFEPKTGITNYLTGHLTLHDLNLWFRDLDEEAKTLFLEEALRLDQDFRHQIFIFSGIAQSLDPAWIEYHLLDILGPRSNTETLQYFITRVPPNPKLKLILLCKAVRSALNLQDFRKLSLPQRPWVPALKEAVLDFFQSQPIGAYRDYLEETGFP